MALAVLRYKGIKGIRQQFIADIGTNAFYIFKIGKEKRNINGLATIDELTYQSPLVNLKKANQIRTDFLLEIPASLFKNRAGYFQLVSFKTKEKVAPAYSDIVRVIPGRMNESRELFPNLALSVSKFYEMKNTTVGHKNFCYKEPTISQAMFWDKIVSALPKIIEVATPVVSGLLGGNRTNGGAAAATPSPDTNAILQAIQEMINQVAQQNNQSPAVAAPTAQAASFHSSSLAFNPAMLVQLAPLLEKVISPETIKAIGDQPVKLFKAVGDAVLKMDQQEMEHLERLNPGVDDPTILPLLNSMSLTNNQYSTAKVAPALLAALPALMPVIEKVLDPKVINAIGDQPVKLFKAIGDAVLKMDQQEMEHLERLNPGVDDPTILPLLNSMSVPALNKPDIRFKIHPAVVLDFVETQTIELNGKARVVYRKGSAIRIPIKVYSKSAKAPKRPIPKAIIQLIVQDSDSMKVLLEKKFQLKSVKLGDTLYDVILDDFEMKMLPVNQDLKVEVSFIWQGVQSGQRIGTFKNHYLTLINQHTFDQLGSQQGTPFLLNDYVQHRAFWHKVWEGGYSEGTRWEIDFDMKYFYALDLEVEKVSRLSTKVKVTKDNAEKGAEPPHKRRVEAQIKSGMELNVEILNQVLPLLGQPELDQAKLDAIKSVDLQSFFNQVARVSLEMKGRAGDTGTLWVYPEISLHQLRLSKIAEVNDFGMVTRTESELILFPHPSAVHFIGTKSK